jgi:acyl carrier protein
MTETRQDIISRIRVHLPFGADPSCEVREEAVLADLGVNSLHLITMLLTLQQEFSLDVELVTLRRLPTTVSDLVTLIEQGMPNERRTGV